MSIIQALQDFSYTLSGAMAIHFLLVTTFTTVVGVFAIGKNIFKLIKKYR